MCMFIGGKKTLNGEKGYQMYYVWCATITRRLWREKEISRADWARFRFSDYAFFSFFIFRRTIISKLNAMILKRKLQRNLHIRLMTNTIDLDWHVEKKMVLLTIEMRSAGCEITTAFFMRFWGEMTYSATACIKCQWLSMHKSKKWLCKYQPRLYYIFDFCYSLTHHFYIEWFETLYLIAHKTHLISALFLILRSNSLVICVTDQ